MTALQALPCPHRAPQAVVVPSLPSVRASAPDLRILLPDGQVAQLPGLLWPEQAATIAHDPQGAPLVSVSRVRKREFNPLLELWEHDLGAYRRGYGYEGFTLDVAGEPIAVAVSSSTVSTTVESVHRRELVELARLCRHPDHPRVLRVLLRLWTDFLGPGWDHLPWRTRADRQWHTRMAVTYQAPGKTGDLYRFDGAWIKVGKRKPSGGGGTWSHRPAVNDVDDGEKTLWVCPYDDELRHDIKTRLSNGGGAP
jgi:hypothetical protein